MAAFVDTTVTEIDNRLRELKDEVSKLEAARAALIGNGSAPAEVTKRRPGRPRRSPAVQSSSPAAAPRRTRARRPGSPGSPGSPGHPRGRRGGNTRSAQALELVRSKPGITIPQLARAMKIEPNYLYRVMPNLASEGQVTRDGQGWHPAS
jgi:hypothetical protein